MIVLAHNLRTYTARTCRHFDFIWTDHFQGCSPNSFVSRPVKVEPINPVSNIMQLLMPPIPNNIAPLYNQPPLPPESKDPYGVTGTWRRIVCFLDYTDLYNFNFEIPSPPHGQPRDPIETQEATRLITIKMFVTKIEPPGPDDGQDLPVVHFNGKARSMHTAWDPNANSRIRGTVRQTKEGEIRWTSFSIFHGEERWRSECIQIGGIRSARGVLGTWFDKDFDPHGPAGPTAYWKLSDDISDEDKTSGLSVWDMGDESD